MPCKVNLNSYLVIDKYDGNLFSKLESVIKHIYETTGTHIDTILGVDTGGDCLYPITMLKENISQDRESLETIIKFEKSGISIYNCIVAPGIDSPNNICTNLLSKANALSYNPNLFQKQSILDIYTELKMDGSSAKRFGKTALIWQSALKGKRGIVTINIPLQNVLSEENPWISTVTIDDIAEKVVYMRTANCLKALCDYEK